MCNAMEIERSVAGAVNAAITAQADLTANEDNHTAAAGSYRSAQPLKDFFVPLSQREKRAKKLTDEVGKPSEPPALPAAAEDAAKKRRGRPKKTSPEDDDKDFFIPPSAKDRSKKVSSVDTITALNSAALPVAEDGAESEQRPKQNLIEDCSSDFFVPISKKERPNKELVKEKVQRPIKKASGGAEDGVKKRGRSRKSSLDSEGNTVKGSPLGEADDNSKPKRGRPKKNLPDDLQDIGKQKQVKPRKKTSGEEGNIKDEVKHCGSLEEAVTSLGQEPHDGQIFEGVVGALKLSEPEVTGDAEASGTALVPNGVENEGQKTVDKEGTQAARGSDPGDLPLSQVTACDDFFMPVSKRRKRKEDLLDKKQDEIGKAPSKLKSQKDGQAGKPSSEGVTILQSVLGKEKMSLPAGNPHKGTAASHPGNALSHSEHDLRLEAALAAQEIARLNAGKITHPFFARKKPSFVKTGAPWEEASTYQVEDLQPGPPIHVTQLSEKERPELIWPEWKVRHILGNEDTKAELRKTERKIGRNMQHFDQRPDSQAISINVSETATSGPLNVEEMNSDSNDSTSSLRALHDLLQHMQTLKSTTDDAGELAQSPDCRRADADLSFENLKDRLSWYSGRHALLNSVGTVTMPQSSEVEGEALTSNRNLLWTDLYQPRSSKEVCGNTTAVEGLSTWLCNWQLKIAGLPIRGEDANKDIKESNADSDNDKGWFEGDSDKDSEASDGEDDTGLHNTLLVTGPEGCGKSAAVYACAGEQGFTVIEVNASDCRNGALIKQKFGEAMESHGLGKGSQFGVESPQPASKKVLNTQENSPGQSKLTGIKQRKLFADKRVPDRSPVKAQQERLIPSPDEYQMDTQSKRKTVILFEDVDKTFEEDKGFLTALLQLSKITKRPIILTSNRYDPALPPVLEQCRVDFEYPSSEELVLHAGLVSIAEDVPCSPWLLERLVDSCHYDLRKVMMTLQFWGQGKTPLQQPSLLCRPAWLAKCPNDVEHHEPHTNGTSNRLSLEHKKCGKLNRSSKLSLSHKQGRGPFEQWKSEARWQFELDVHYFILPKVISGSFMCPFTVLVGKTINTAVKQLEEHTEYFAASESVERGRAQQAEYEASEVTRKALKKEKDALRKASQSGARVLDDGGVIDLTPDEDTDPENRSSESWTPSPLRSLREAKTLARSPLKPKIRNSRRALILCDSDDEDQGLHKHRISIEASNQSISNVEAHSPVVQIITVKPNDNNADVVSEHLEDNDVINSSISESLTQRRRRRLSKKNSTLETNAMKVKSLADVTGELPNLKVEPLGVQTNEIRTESQFIGPEVTPRILAEESNRPLLVVNEYDRLPTELTSSLSRGSGISTSLEMEGRQLSHNFGFGCDEPQEPIFSSGGEGLLFETTSSYMTALLGPDFIEERDNVDDRLLMASPGLQSHFGEVLEDVKDALLEPESTGDPEDITCGIVGSFQTISESAEKTVANVSLSPHFGAQEAAAEGLMSPFFEPVNEAWESLRKTQQTSKTPLHHSETSADVTSSLADLLDIISASDAIAYVEPEEYKDAWRNFEGCHSEAFEGNIGHSSDWDSCQEIASELVCTGFRQYLPLLPAIKHADDRLPVLSCVLECANDAPSVGRCMVTHGGLSMDSPHQSNKLYGMVGNISAKMNLLRQADRQSRLGNVVNTAAVPRGIVSRSGMVEYSAYLSRMSQLEQIRRTNGLIQGRRPRRFEHKLTSKLKSLTNSDITALLNYSSYRSS